MNDKRPNRRDTPAARASAPRVVPALSAGWAAALLALLVVVFFHEVSVGGKTFLSPDATAPAGFVRMGEQSLNHDHVYPLWNPYVFLGMPSFASGAYNPYIYPPDWPVAVLQKFLPLPDLTWMLLYYWVGAFAMFLLAREWGARAEGAVLAGAAFVFAPNLVAVGSHGHGSQLVDSAYLPLMVWLATRWMRRGGLADLGWLALAGGFQMLRGHVQICFYTWMAVGIYAGIEWLAGLARADRRVPYTLRAAGIGIAVAVAFGIAAFYNLPLRDYAQWSIRGGGEGGGLGMQRATQWSLSLAELPTIVIPGFAGFGGQTYWGGMPFTDYPNAYLGMVAVVLALPAFAAGFGVARAFAVALGLIAIFISFGHNSPLYGFLYDHLPLFNKFRIPVMILLLFQLAGALALAWGWSAALERAPESAKGAKAADPVGRTLLASAAVLALGFLLAIAGGGLLHGPYVALATSNPQVPPQAAEIAFQMFVTDLGRVSLLGLLALGAAWLARGGRLPASLATLVALALLLGELWPVSGRVMQPVIGDVQARDLEAGRDDTIEFLEKAGPPGSFRILPLSFPEFQNNRFAGFGIASVGGYHAAKPRAVQDFLDAQLQNDPVWWRLLNVRFVIAPQAIDQLPPWLREAHRGASGVVYENLLALPRATVVGAVRVAPATKAILDSVRAGGADPAAVTWLDRAPDPAPGDVAGATAEITSYRLNDVTVKVRTPGPGVLRLADAWYPDWKVAVDGKPADLLRADYLLRAVAVPAGEHEVRFTFDSPSLGLGRTLSIVSAIVAILMIGAGLLLARRAKPASAGEGAA